jgi:hypothetical protein
MRRRVIVFSAIAAALILVASNPSGMAFREWLDAHYEVRIDSGSYNRLAGVDSGIANSIRDAVEHPTISVERRTLLFCSIFSADFGGARLRFVGVLGQFIPLQR